MLQPLYVHLHGFASSSESRKGLLLAQRFAAAGRELLRPDLNVPSFGRQTTSAALAHLDSLYAAQDPARPWRLSGSSLGGYLAVLWASLHPERVEALGLLCPAFGLSERWVTLLGEETFASWEAQGSLPLPDASGQPQALHWEFVTDARRYPARPATPCRSLVFHGSRDLTVPLASSRQFAATQPGLVRLRELDDDHGLLASTPRIAQELLEFYGP